MVLADRQWSLRGLVMGPGTQYEVLTQTNPFRLQSSASTGSRAWDHGSWAGAEWAGSKTVPLRVLVKGAERDPDSWLEAHQNLTAAFAPRGASTIEDELRFGWNGREYVMFGRPRVVEPNLDIVGRGYSFTQCAFESLDPRIYDADPVVQQTNLPVFEGGLALPFSLPATIDSVAVEGSDTIVNEGKTDTGIVLRLYGPLVEPRVALRESDGTTRLLRFRADIEDGHYVEIDTQRRTVLLDGDQAGSRRRFAAGEFFLVPPGTSTLFLRSGSEDPGYLISEYRSAWW